MKKNPTSLFIVLLLLIAAIGIWIGNTPNSPAPDSPSSATKAKDDPQLAASELPKEDREAWAQRLSPPAWVPPAVFAAKGSPSPQIPFPRGENATRRYHAAKTTELAPDLKSSPPAILAQSPADGRFHLLPDEIDLHTRLGRRMVLDTSALDSIVQGNTSRLLAPTVSDEVLTLEFKSVKTRARHTHTLSGHVAGEESTSNVQLVYHDGVVHGTVARYTAATNRHLEYRILTDGHMMVRDLDTSTMTANCGGGIEAEVEAAVNEISNEPIAPAAQEGGEILQDTIAWRTIDIVVGYDQGARIADGGYAQIEARIIASVDGTTTAFGNSQITDTEAVLLGTIEDPNYVFPGSDAGGMYDELSSLNSFNDGILTADFKKWPINWFPDV